jgi:predicted TPR repeat methyltransferase
VNSPRVEKVRAMLAASPDDTFLLYALAMEYKKTDAPQSIELLRRVIQLDPLQSYAYFQLGQVQELTGDTEAAKDAYRQGIAAAGRAGDDHARHEITAALAAIED